MHSPVTFGLALQWPCFMRVQEFTMAIFTLLGDANRPAPKIEIIMRTESSTTVPR